MEQPINAIDSTTMGDPTRFLTLLELQAGLQQLLPAPKKIGRVMRMVSRGEGGLRHLPPRVQLTREGGMPGDAWARRENPKPEAQLTVMQWEVAQLLCNGQPLELAGDNLWLDLDLSAANLPIGSRLRMGNVLLEVTPKPHNGCKNSAAVLA